MKIEIEREDDGRWIAEVPELPGFLCILCASMHVYAEDSDLTKLFHDRNVVGTIVISSLDGKTNYIHNLSRAEERFLPASTFKIPNTLIALEEGVIKDEQEIIRWDGKDKGRKEWNKDQSLETAFPLSCVWFYQELAKRVGNDRYLRHFQTIRYGNQQTGRDVTTLIHHQSKNGVGNADWLVCRVC